MVRVGVALGDTLIVNGRKLDAVLSGLSTNTLTGIAAARSAAGTVAVNTVLDTNVVGASAVPFQMIWLPLAKPVPVAVRGNAALPLKALSGLIEVSVGGVPLPPPGPPPPVIVKLNALDVVVSAFITRTLTVPAAAICAAVIDAVSCVFETTVVGCATPSHKICVPLVKFVPVAVKVKAAEPAATEAGLIDERVGVTTPLKPPQPEKNMARNGSTDRMQRLNTLIGDSAFLKTMDSTG